MLRRIAVLSLLLGILPAVSHAVPRDSGSNAPAAVRSAEGWLAQLGRLLGGAWTRVTENTGKSIDPDGQPQSLPEAPSSDTGMSIDPNG